ncbi:phosphate-starvation-inducible PsiE family protein [Sideroxydans sp. CL21]|uniref:phosphate-starvation-inducible PsiE family protein n=1 Tax=Sideroxydans sp. CL21 TaxID=2600596 RepID=UPI0024BC6C4F|nr:phosphate-starvation-inducible PsiE family protein [Sideroxydans sp. CL21]
MQEKLQAGNFPSDPSKASAKGKALRIYGRFLDLIVTALIFVMVLTLIGALVGLVIDFLSAANSFGSAVSSHNIVHGIVDGIDRELVIDVLSVFVLIELFRTFTDYLEFHRVRLRVLAEVGIAFVLREVFIGLYDHSMNWTEILALSFLLAILVATRIAAVQFQPQKNGSE